MTAALKCDGPGCAVVATEEDPTLELWWVVTRQGDGLGSGPFVLKSSFHSTIDVRGLDDDEDDETEADLPEPEEADEVRRHFHRAACLAAWASEADALEDPDDGPELNRG